MTTPTTTPPNLSRVWAEDLSGLGANQQLAPVQVGHEKLVPAQGLNQRHVLANEQVIVLAREDGVLLFLQDEDHVAGLAVRLLVAHASEANLLSVLHPALNVNLQHL